MYDLILAIVGVLGILFPIFYTYKNNIKNPMLFIFAILGGSIAITVLVAGVFFAYYISSIYFIPQADVLGYTKNIDGLLSFIEIIGDYIADFIFSALLFVLPVLIKKRYGSIFES